MIFVTGVTGRHGGTGAYVARELARRGERVRALVRQDGAAPLEGVELVRGDLRDRSSLVRSLAGVNTAYFTWPVAPGIVEAAATFASAGKETGLERVVVMSMGAANPNSPSALARAQWLAEQVLEWAGLKCLHLRIAAFFFENLRLLHGAEIEGDGVLRSAFADVAVPWIAAEDAAKLAVAALLEPERFAATSTAVYPTGGHSHTHAEVARIVGEQVGRPLRHETISKEAWERLLVERGSADGRINPELAAHIAALAAAMRAPRETNDLFERVTGTRPLSLAQALARGLLSS